MWCNGNKLTSTQLDRGLQFGDGHFTTLTREQGQLRWWAAHWQRLKEASCRLAMQLPNESEVLACLEQIEAANAVIKIIITRGDSARGYGFSDAIKANWYVTAAELPERKQEPLTCAVAEFTLARSPFFAGLKTLNRLEQVMLSRERQQRAVDELLVCDSAGNLIEATSSNLFLRIDGAWHTPALEHAGVAGVVRQQLLASQALGSTQVSHLPLSCLTNIDQAFVTNSVLGLRPLAQIGDHRLPEQQLPKALTSWWES